MVQADLKLWPFKVGYIFPTSRPRRPLFDDKFNTSSVTLQVVSDGSADDKPLIEAGQHFSCCTPKAFQ